MLIPSVSRKTLTEYEKNQKLSMKYSIEKDHE